jgi:drug/metabolite transporter (DMT)-like permease
MNFPWKAHLSIFLANLIYGANYSIAREVMPLFFKPFGLILMRVAGAIILFLILFNRKIGKIDPDDRLRFLLCGISGVAINQLCFFKGLSMSTPIEAAIILTANPLLVLVASAFILKERITSKKLIGIALGMTGALILILQRPQISPPGYNIAGNLLILINAASYAVYLVLVRPLMKKYSIGTVMFYVFAIGFVFVLPFGVSEATDVNWNAIPSWAFASLAFIIVGTTFLAYLFNAYGLSKVNAGVVSSYIYLQPFLAALIAISWGKDHLDLNKIISALFVFLGVYLISSGYYNSKPKT